MDDAVKRYKIRQKKRIDAKRCDYGVQGMKWGHHKASTDEPDTINGSGMKSKAENIEDKMNNWVAKLNEEDVKYKNYAWNRRKYAIKKGEKI